MGRIWDWVLGREPEPKSKPPLFTPDDTDEMRSRTDQIEKQAAEMRKDPDVLGHVAMEKFNDRLDRLVAEIDKGKDWRDTWGYPTWGEYNRYRNSRMVQGRSLKRRIHKVGKGKWVVIEPARGGEDLAVYPFFNHYYAVTAATSVALEDRLYKHGFARYARAGISSTLDRAIHKHLTPEERGDG